MSEKPGILRLVPRTALGRLGVALVAGGAAGALVWARSGPAVSLLVGWIAGGLCLLAITWALIHTSSAAQTRRLAASEDPGRTAVFVMATAASAVALFAAAVLSRQAGRDVSRPSHALLGLCLGAVALSWVVTHTIFTLRYAHLYYREDREGVGGASFPGDAPPTYFDFAYLAFTVGMCFQVSDVTISSPQLRRAILVHAVISFAYNTAILAFALNLAFSP